MQLTVQIVGAAALLIGASLLLWLAKALFDYFFTTRGDFWRQVAERPKLALSLLAAERGCLIDPDSRPNDYLGPFYVLEHKVYLPLESADAIKAHVAEQLKRMAVQQKSLSDKSSLGQIVQLRVVPWRVKGTESESYGVAIRFASGAESRYEVGTRREAEQEFARLRRIQIGSVRD